jgi:hypothetical protein
MREGAELRARGVPEGDDGGEEVVGRGATNWQRQRPWVVAEPSEEDGGRGVRAPAAATASERGATKVMGRRTVGG